MPAGLISASKRCYEEFPTRSRGYKTFFILSSLGMEFMLHINVKKPTIVDIFTFICRINDVYCGSLLHAFSGRVFMPFHLMCVV